MFSFIGVLPDSEKNFVRRFKNIIQESPIPTYAEYYARQNPETDLTYLVTDKNRENVLKLNAIVALLNEMASLPNVTKNEILEKYEEAMDIFYARKSKK
jgi:hypothetical protein